MRMHQKHKSFTFAKEGILHSKTDIALTKIRTRWATFCQISYFNHEGPPTEENFIDFLSKKKESGRTLQYIAELYATLCKVLWPQWWSCKKKSQLGSGSRFFSQKTILEKSIYFIWLSSYSSKIGHHDRTQNISKIKVYILRRPQNFAKSSPYFDWHYTGQK